MLTDLSSAENENEFWSVFEPSTQKFYCKMFETIFVLKCKKAQHIHGGSIVGWNEISDVSKNNGMTVDS